MIIITWREVEPTDRILTFADADPLVLTASVKKQITWSIDDSDKEFEAAKRYIASEEFCGFHSEYKKVIRVK